MAFLSFTSSGLLLFCCLISALSVRNFCPNFKKIEIAVMVSLITLSPLFTCTSFSFDDDPCISLKSPSSPCSLFTYFFGCRDCACDISVMIFFLNDFVIFLSVSLSMGYAVFTTKEKREPILSVPRFFMC